MGCLGVKVGLHRRKTVDHAGAKPRAFGISEPVKCMVAAIEVASNLNEHRNY